MRNFAFQEGLFFRDFITVRNLNPVVVEKFARMNPVSVGCSMQTLQAKMKMKPNYQQYVSS
jgi:hypothetical protein